MNRNFFIESYVPQSLIDKVIASKGDYIRHYAYILHDRDIYPPTHPKTGEKKVAHWHILLCLSRPAREESVKRWFFDAETGQNTNTQVAKDVASCFEYELHRNAPEKVQYTESEIHSDDIEYFRGICDNPIADDTTFLALSDMLDGKPLSELAKKYGRDFILNYSRIKALYDDIRQEDSLMSRKQYLTEECYKLSRDANTAKTTLDELENKIHIAEGTLQVLAAPPAYRWQKGNYND